jgi:hypothetical protein
MRITALEIASVLISAAVGIGGFYFASGVWKRTFWGKAIIRRRKRSPLREAMLRHPGQTLSESLRDNTMDLMSSSMVLVFIPLIVAFLYGLMARVYTGFAPFVIFVLICCASSSPSFFKVLMLSKKRRALRLGLDGELATGEELNQLMHHGYYVFHDFPAEGFNIDHVIIGPSGVFGVETKACAKYETKAKNRFKVFVHGSHLKFPTYDNGEYVGQARDRAKWLSGFLSKSVGKTVRVHPVLALPGWLVERVSHSNDVDVINPKEIVGLLSAKKTSLDKQTMEQIRFQVERSCRSVEPYAPL